MIRTPRIRGRLIRRGYAHEEVEGDFDEDVTEDEIQQYIHDTSPFGGRDLRVDMTNRKFWYTRHTD